MDAMNYKESDSVSPGKAVAVFDTDMAKVGVMVCYELRASRNCRERWY